MLPANFAAAQFIERPGEATYDPRTGRITVTVMDAFSWTISSKSGQLTGPDDVVLSGVLPATPFFPDVSLVTNTDYVIGEANFRMPQFSYGPLDLGRVAQPNIPMGDLEFSCQCPINAEQLVKPVRYVPEPITFAFGWIAATTAVLWQSFFDDRRSRSI
jgi:hypothetical protein